MFKANDSEESPFSQVRPSSKYSAASVQPCEPDVDDNSHVNGEYANVNWDELRFDLTPTDYMYITKCSKEDNFSPGTLTPLGNMEMSPSSGILNYSQGVLEGMKAYRTEDGRILLFRPELNALRMKMGAQRLCMPSPTVDQFLDAVKQTVNANKRWVANTFNPADYFYFPIFLSLNCNKFISGYGEKVPPPGKGSMYIRPLLIGSGSMLNLGTANEHTFLTYVSPVGNFHKGMVNLVVAENVYRATPGGTGGIKAICNYAAIYRTISEAKAKGFSDVLFLDVVTGKRIEEASTSNIFIVKGNIISTPATQGTILPGITRKSIIEIARVLGYQVEERDILVEELFDAEEVFCTGTAVVVNFVNSITYQSRRVEYKTGVETVSQKLYAALTGIQTGRIEDKMGWTVQLD